MSEKNNFVALVHEACPICGKPDAHSQIVIHKYMRDVSEMHGKTTGYGRPCEECQKGFDMDGV